MIAKAAQGTLFLDELGDLSIESQIQLLRLLQEREYYPLGSDISRTTDARFVFAKNHDLESRVRENSARTSITVSDPIK
jgi:transcriptional regulator with GAF, ATPase, and Fis domain